MAQQNIDFGTFPDDPSADPIRLAFQKTQQNFDEIYAGLTGASVLSINKTPGAGISVNQPTGNVVVTANIACVQVSTSTLSIGRGGNGSTTATITSSGQTLVLDINPNQVRSNNFSAVGGGLANIVGTLTSNANAQPNITSLGILSSLSVSGNITSGNASLGNLAVASYFQGDGSLLTNLNPPTGNALANGNSTVFVYNNSNIAMTVAGNANILLLTGTGANVNGYLNTTGNLTAANANLGDIVTSNHFIGEGGNLSNIQGANVTGTVATANLANTVSDNAQPNITSLGTLSNLSVTGNTFANYISLSNTLYISGPGNVDFNNAANVTLGTVGNLHIGGGSISTYLTTDGAGNLSWQTLVNSPPGGVDGSILFNELGANYQGSANFKYDNANSKMTLSGTMTITGNANVGNLVTNLMTGTITAASNSQPNIKDVGTLNYLIVSGNTNSGNFVTNGNLYLGASSGLSANNSFGTKGQVLTASGSNTAIWSTHYYYGPTPPAFSDLNYGDIFFYDDGLGFQRMYMWVTDGGSDYFYDFLPPSF